METILFATGNEGKIKEMTPPFQAQNLELKQVDVDVPEIDAMSVEEVAEQKVRDSFEAAREQGLVDGDKMLIVEDTGLFVESLNGFPGVETAFFARTAGADKLLKLLDDEEDRNAYFKTAIAAYMPEKDEVKIVTGKMTGRIPEGPKGESHPHLPYNTYFVPDHGDGESLAENEDLKNEEMHRRKAVNQFLDWVNQ